MKDAMRDETEAKNELANAVIRKYKEILFGGPEYGQRTENEKDILFGAVAIYRISNDYYAKRNNNVGCCGFPRKVVGPALLAWYRSMQEKKPLVIAMSVAKELFYFQVSTVHNM